MKKLKIGIIGCGMIAQYHVNAYKKLGDIIEIVAICDIDDKVLIKKSKEWKVPKCYTNYKDLIKDNDLDVIDIMVPHNEHTKIIIDLSSVIKNILVEKPLCISPDEAEIIKNETDKYKTRIMVANNLLFHPTIKTLHQLINSGIIGKISYIEAHSLGWFNYNTHNNFRLKLEKCGGGALLDTGIHFVYLLRYLIGDILKVNCFNGNLLNEFHDYVPEGEDTAIIIMEFAKNILGTLAISYSIKLPNWKKGFPQGWNQKINIYGSSGTIKADLIENKVSVFSGKNEEWVSYLPEFENKTNTLPPGFAHNISYDKEIKHFIDCISKNKDFIREVTIESAIQDLKVIKAMYNSYSTQRTITIK